MKKYFTLMLLMISVQIVVCQKPTTVEIMYTITKPEIDGYDEGLWSFVDPVPIEQDFIDESPTVTAYWKALWDSTSFFVLIFVEDDDHYPSWKSGGSWWEYDQPEIYFDFNAELKDGLGAKDGQGHWQVQPGFEENSYGTTLFSTPTDFRPYCKYCYELLGEDYLCEYEFFYDTLTNKEGEKLSIQALKALDQIGFDVTIIDQDEGITESRQRAVWSNTGDIDENYNNMDDAGTIVLVDNIASVKSIKSKNNQDFLVYPNPVIDFINVIGDNDEIIIYDILGQKVWKSKKYRDKIYLGMLPEGVYFIEGLKDKKRLGISKIILE